MSSGAKSCNINEMFRIFTLPHKYTMILASADKGRHGFSRGKTTPGVVILVGGRQPTCLVCLPSRRLSSVKNSEGLAGRSGATYARQRTQAYWRKSRTTTQQMAAQADPQACMPLSADAAIQETDEGGLTDMNDNTIKFVVPPIKIQGRCIPILCKPQLLTLSHKINSLHCQGNSPGNLCLLF